MERSHQRADRDRSSRLQAAVKACVEALSGKIAPEQFREALLPAAEEVDIAALSLIRKRRPGLPSSAQR
ncbi:DUF982 domain-containing protein [Rhizobium leguminosarum bv. viciae]|nr:DUF982 domain-containing protein [Rhizobium leguminosarum bv. viciae]